MLKITAIGNLTNDVELKMNETTGKPYAILRIASDRRYAQKNDWHAKSLLSVLDTALCYHSRADHTRGCMPILKKELIYWRYASTRKCATIRKVCFLDCHCGSFCLPCWRWPWR